VVAAVALQLLPRGSSLGLDGRVSPGPTLRIAKWDGAGWSALGSGMDRNVLALGVFDDDTGPALYAGGTFATAGGRVSSSIAAWRCARP